MHAARVSLWLLQAVSLRSSPACKLVRAEVKPWTSGNKHFPAARHDLWRTRVESNPESQCPERAITLHTSFFKALRVEFETAHLASRERAGSR